MHPPRRAHVVPRRSLSQLHSLRRCLGITLALALLAACGGTSGAGSTLHPLLVPANAFGSDDPPAFAVPITPEAFAAGLDDGSLSLITPAQLTEEEAAAQMQMEADKARAEALYATRSEILTRHTEAPPGGHADFVQLPDTTWLYRVVDTNPTNNEPEQIVVLNGNRTGYADLAFVTERFNTRANQEAAYREMYGRLDPTYISRNALPNPDTLGTLALNDLINLNDGVALDWPAFQVGVLPLPPAGYPADWAAEEGRGSRGDSAVLKPGPTGLWADVHFPLKWCVTSVKAQGRRGTCTAFGLTAAVEAIVARDLGRWVNLSEQMLYDRAKQIWWPSKYGDGLYTGPMLLKMNSLLYGFSWESSWDYNPSRHRFDGDPTPIYFNSCLAGDDGESIYSGEHCSDSNHQATMVCTTYGGVQFYGFEDPAGDVPADAGFRIAGFTAVNDPGVIGPTWAKAMLALKIPVIIDVTVPLLSMKGFLVTPAGGIVSYVAGEEGTSAGHVMLLVGYVPNASLPTGTPPGAGGGYFICKNSWGAGYGDAGYMYLPDDWVTRFSRALYVIEGVAP